MKKTLTSVLLTFALSTFANTPFIERSDVKSFINDVEKQYHLSKEELLKTLAEVKLQQPVLQSIKNPKEAKAWTDYRSIFITESRIKAGLKFQENNQLLLQKAEKTYGVPQEIIVAILGVETNFGTKQGQYRVLDSLATLAFNFSARSHFFKKELANFLVLCREQKFEPTSVYGSYAGAIGQPQFMPSSYRAYAVDFSGDGKKDLRKNTADAIGSVANYLHVHGWQKNEGVTEKAVLKGSGYKQMVTQVTYAKHQLKRLHRSGVETNNAKHATKGSLLEFKSPTSTEYWLAYPNFFVITKYNTSKQYALAVHLLAEKFKPIEKKNTLVL